MLLLRRACFASSLWQLTCLLLSLSLGARTCKQPTNASLRRVASFPAACCRCRVLTCLLHFAGSAVCEPQRLQAHRKLQDASAAASAASGAASGAAAAGASSESTSAAAAAAAAATGEASLLYGNAHPLLELELECRIQPVKADGVACGLLCL